MVFKVATELPGCFLPAVEKLNSNWKNTPFYLEFHLKKIMQYSPNASTEQ